MPRGKNGRAFAQNQRCPRIPVTESIELPANQASREQNPSCVDAYLSSNSVSGSLGVVESESEKENGENVILDPPSPGLSSQCTLLPISFCSQWSGGELENAEIRTQVSIEGETVTDSVPLGHLADATQSEIQPSQPKSQPPSFRTLPLLREDNESHREYSNRCAQEGFGIESLHDEQLEALDHLIWKGDRTEDCDDVVFIAKTSFGKSILFQLAPLIVTRYINQDGKQSAQRGIVLVLMPLNLLLDEQAAFTEGRLGAHCVVLTRGSMSIQLLQRVEEGEFTHVFTSPEIAEDDNFRAHVFLGKTSNFKNRLVAIVLDEAHLALDWGLQFRETYSRIWNIRQSALHAPLLAVSATLSQYHVQALQNLCGLRPGQLHIIRTSIDRPEIFLRVQPLYHTQQSFFDLAVLLPSHVQKPTDIPKTLVFIDSIRGIETLLQLMRQWMRTLKYPRGHQDWVKTYFASMDNLTKRRIAEEFSKPNNQTDRGFSTVRIVLATSAYGMGINNPDVWRVVIWLAPVTAADWQQRAGRAMRKAKQNEIGQCILFVPKKLYRHEPRKDSSLGKGSSLSQSQSVDEPDEDLGGFNTASDSEASSLKEDVTERVQGEPSSSQQNNTSTRKSANNKGKKGRQVDSEVLQILSQGGCLRVALLKALSDNTYHPGHSRPLPKPCCSYCDPKEQRLPLIPPNLRQPGKRRDGEMEIRRIWIKQELEKWRNEKAQNSADKICRRQPSMLMPDSILRDIWSNWYDGESVVQFRSQYSHWSGCTRYAQEILDLINQIRNRGGHGDGQGPRCEIPRSVFIELESRTHQRKVAQSEKRAGSIKKIQIEPLTPKQIALNERQQHRMSWAVQDKATREGNSLGAQEARAGVLTMPSRPSGIASTAQPPKISRISIKKTLGTQTAASRALSPITKTASNKSEATGGKRKQVASNVSPRKESPKRAQQNSPTNSLQDSGSGHTPRRSNRTPTPSAKRREGLT